MATDMKGFEEVRLSDSVRSDHEDEPRLEVEVERGIRAKIAERDVRDDQPASRIGMIK